MELTLEQIKSIAFGAAYIDEKGGMISLHRFTAEQEDLYRTVSDDFYSKTFASAGIYLEFLSDSRELELFCFLTPASSRLFFSISVFVDGEPSDELKMSFADKENRTGYVGKAFKLGDTNEQRKVTVYLPWSFCAQICKLAIDDGAYIKPVEKKTKMMIFGDSISQGYDAHSTHGSYASILSRMLDADARNKGIGGEIFRPELASLRDDDFRPDIITVAYGTNDWCAWESYESMQKNCDAFYGELVKNYPSAKIFALSPIWRKDFAEVTRVGEFDNAKEIIKKAAEKHSSIIFIDAYDFVPHSLDLMDDRFVHPNDEGFEHYANALYEVIKNHV